MKKLLIITLFLVVNVALAAYTPPPEILPPDVGPPDAIASMVIGTGPPAAGGDYSDIVFWLNFETGDNSDPYTMSGTNEYSAGDTTGTFENQVAVVDTSSIMTTSRVGSYGAFSTHAGDGMAFDVSSNDILPQSFRIAVWFEVDPFAAYQNLIYATGTNVILEISTTGTTELKVQYTWATSQNVSVITTDASLVAGTTYCVEVILDSTESSEDITVKVDGVTASDGGLVYADQSPFDAISAWTAMKVISGGDGADYWIGKTIISNDISRDLYTDFDTVVNYPGN